MMQPPILDIYSLVILIAVFGTAMIVAIANKIESKLPKPASRPKAGAVGTPARKIKRPKAYLVPPVKR